MDNEDLMEVDEEEGGDGEMSDAQVSKKGKGKGKAMQPTSPRWLAQFTPRG